jgi:hypothetical protein
MLRPMATGTGRLQPPAREMIAGGATLVVASAAVSVWVLGAFPVSEMPPGLIGWAYVVPSAGGLVGMVAVVGGFASGRLVPKLPGDHCPRPPEQVILGPVAPSRAQPSSGAHAAGSTRAKGTSGPRDAGHRAFPAVVAQRGCRRAPMEGT